MIITATFTLNSLGVSDLTPLITIRQVSDGTVLVNAASMTQTGGGHYYYDYTLYDPNINIIFTCDAGTDSVDSRYVHGPSSDPSTDSGYFAWEELTANHVNTGTTGKLLVDINTIKSLLKFLA